MLRDAGLPADVNANAAIGAITPLGRVGLPSDIASLALFLASDESSDITGAELVIDGGLTVGY